MENLKRRSECSLKVCARWGRPRAKNISARVTRVSLLVAARAVGGAGGQACAAFSWRKNPNEENPAEICTSSPISKTVSEMPQTLHVVAIRTAPLTCPFRIEAERFSTWGSSGVTAVFPHFLHCMVFAPLETAGGSPSKVETAGLHAASEEKLCKDAIWPINNPVS